LWSAHPLASLNILKFRTDIHLVLAGYSLCIIAKLALYHSEICPGK
jgi:hypothetical protein